MALCRPTFVQWCAHRVSDTIGHTLPHVHSSSNNEEGVEVVVVVAVAEDPHVKDQVAMQPPATRICIAPQMNCLKTQAN